MVRDGPFYGDYGGFYGAFIARLNSGCLAAWDLFSVA